MIKQLDAKILILVGDLYNFKALKMSSRLSHGFEHLTKVEEILSKVYFTQEYTKTEKQKFVSKFYDSVVEGMLNAGNSRLEPFLKPMDMFKSRERNVAGEVMDLATDFHPSSSLISYHL